MLRDLLDEASRRVGEQEAETQLLQALDGVRNALGDDHTYTRLTAKELIDLYESWQKPENAAKYRAMFPPKS